MEDLQKETLIDSVNYDSIMSALVGESEKLEKQLTDNHGYIEADVSVGVAAHHSASYEGVQLEQLNAYPEKLNECLDDKTNNEELIENYQPLQEDVTSEGNESSFNVTKAVLALFPFVCGICDEKFNSVASYFMHISMHGNILTLLHCCQTASGDAEDSILFSCGICDIKYPTLCTLYEHLAEAEGVTDFVYRGRERTAYACTDNIENLETQTNSADCHSVREGIPHAFNLDVNSDINVDITKTDIANSLDKHDNDNSPGKSGGESDTTIINEDDIEEQIKVGRKYMKDIEVTERNCIKNKKIVKKKVNDYNRDRTNKNKKIRRRDSIKRTTLKDTNLQTSMRGATRSAAIATADVDDETNVVCEEDDIVDAYDDTYTSQEDTATDKNTKDIKKKRVTINRKDQLFPCEVCGAVVKHKSLHRHRLSHEERTLACDQCDNVYNCKFKLSTHKKQVHTDEKRFTCDECGKSFKAWPYLKQHRQVHIKERNILCPVCPMKFKYAAVLRVHMKTHSDQKPHSCEQCGMKFKRADLLTTHKRYHMEDKPFSCPECSKMFKVKQDMKKHFKVHLPPKFFCGICGKSFVQKYNMRTHMKVHGEFHNK